MVLVTLRAMALGGMRDHLGGGFHRYSVDGDWRVPHFEKMLYDQAQLVLAYVEAAQLTGDPFFADVAADTLAYVRRDLRRSRRRLLFGRGRRQRAAGAGERSRAAQERGRLLHLAGRGNRRRRSATTRTCSALRYGVLPDGNAPFDPQNEFTHKNLLYTAQIDRRRRVGDRPSASTTVETALERGRGRLLAVRSRPAAAASRRQGADRVERADDRRIRARGPRARAGRRRTWTTRSARRVVRPRRTSGTPPTETLLRRYRQGEAGVEAYAEDYAYLIFGLLELFQADGDPAWLEWALTLQRRQDELFWDPADGGWFSTTGQDPSVLLRLKEEYDGAEPAATSVGRAQPADAVAL